MTIQDSLAKFLEDRKRRCVPRIVEWYASHVGLFAQWIVEQDKTEIDAITLDDLERYLDSLRERDCINRPGKMSPVTIRKRMAGVKTFFSWATRAGILANNPAINLRLPKAGRRLPKSLTPEQVHTLLSVEMNALERAIIYLILDSGLRLSETLDLDLSDLDLARGVAHVRHGKGDKERYVIFGEEARKALEAWLEKRIPAGPAETAVFLGQRGKFRQIGMYKLIRRIAERAGIKLHPHMLRHTFATQYLDAGGSIVDLRDLLGHTDIKTTTIYVSVSLEHLRAKHKSFSPLSRAKLENVAG